MAEENFFDDFGDDDIFSDDTKNKSSKKNTSKRKIVSINQNTVSITSILNKVKAFKDYLNDNFPEREEVINDIVLALVSKQNIFLYGKPGTGKSALVCAANSLISGSNYFQWLLNKSSDPSEILGPTSIIAMKQEIYKRKTTGKLPEATIAFLDEIFKCNSAVLNILLPLINERIFYNDGKPVPVPLITLFGASNEFPERGSGLEALYDRLTFRENIEYLKKSTSRLKMYDLHVIDTKNIAPIIDISEINTLIENRKKVKIDKSVFKEFEKMFIKLETDGIKVSDRRRNMCIDILQANAILNGRNAVDIGDFKSLKNVLWEKIEEIDKIDKILLDYANPEEAFLNEQSEIFREITEELNKKDAPSSAVIEISAKLNALDKKINNKIGKRTIKDFPADVYKGLMQLKADIAVTRSNVFKDNLEIETEEENPSNNDPKDVLPY